MIGAKERHAQDRAPAHGDVSVHDAPAGGAAQGHQPFGNRAVARLPGRRLALLAGSAPPLGSGLGNRAVQRMATRAQVQRLGSEREEEDVLDVSSSEDSATDGSWSGSFDEDTLYSYSTFFEDDTSWDGGEVDFAAPGPDEIGPPPEGATGSRLVECPIQFPSHYVRIDEYARGRHNSGLRELIGLLRRYETTAREPVGNLSARDANLRLAELEVLAEACKRLQFTYAAKLPEAHQWRMNERQQREDEKPLIARQKRDEKALAKQRAKDAKTTDKGRKRAAKIIMIDGTVKVLSALLRHNQDRIIALARRAAQQDLSPDEGEQLNALQSQQNKLREDLTEQQVKLARALAPRPLAPVDRLAPVKQAAHKALDPLATGALVVKGAAQGGLTALKHVPGALKKTAGEAKGAVTKTLENAATSPLHNEIRLEKKRKKRQRRREERATRRRGIVEMIVALQAEIAAERRRIEGVVAARDAAKLDEVKDLRIFHHQGLLPDAGRKLQSGARHLGSRYNPANFVAGEHVEEEGIVLRPSLFSIEELEAFTQQWAAFEEELAQAGDGDANRATVLFHWRTRGPLPPNLLPVDTSAAELLAARSRILLVEMELRQKREAERGRKPESDGLLRRAIDFTGKAKAAPILGLAPLAALLVEDVNDIARGDEKKKASAKLHIKFHLLDVCTQLNRISNVLDVASVAGDFIPYVGIIAALPPAVISALRLLVVELEREMFTDALKHADKHDPLRIAFGQIEDLLVEREVRLTAALGAAALRTGVAIATNLVPVPGVGSVSGVVGMATTGVLVAEEVASSQKRAKQARKTRDTLLSGGAGTPALEHDPRTAILSIIQSARANCVRENPAVRLITSFGIKRDQIATLDPQELLSMFMMVLDLSEDPTNLRGTVSEGVTSAGGTLTTLKHQVTKHSRQGPSKEERRARSAARKHLEEAFGLEFHDVSGSGLNCLIRALLVAAGHEPTGDLVHSLRMHLVAQNVAERVNMLDLVGEDGGVLISEMVRRGLLDAGRAILLYTPGRGTDPIRIVGGDMENPIRLWLEGGHFQVIRAPGPGRVARIGRAGRDVVDAALTTTSAGRAHFREQKTLGHMEALARIRESVGAHYQSDDIRPTEINAVRELLDVLDFALAQKQTKRARAHFQVGAGLLPGVDTLVDVSALANAAKKKFQGTLGAERERHARSLIALARSKGPCSAPALDVLHNLLDGDKEAIGFALCHDDGWTIVADKMQSR